MTAIAVHCVGILLLTVVPLHRSWIAPKLKPVATSFTFVGMAGGGGNPKAGGAAPSPAPVKPVEQSTAPPPPPHPPPVVAPAPPPPPVIAVVTTEHAPSPFVPPETNETVAAATATGRAGGQGAGIGLGTGTGEGDGTEDGIAGSEGDGPGGFGPANYLQAPKPLYPAVALRAGWEGTTLLQVEVFANGTVGVVRVVTSSGHRILDKAAMDAVRRAQFQPARHGNSVTNSWVEIPISFRLNRS